MTLSHAVCVRVWQAARARRQVWGCTMAQSIPLQESWQPMEHEEVMFRLKTQGWVIIPSVIPHDEVEPIRRDMERVYAERGRSRVDYILNYLDHSSHSFSKYLADPRILAPVHEAFGGQHVRVRSNAGFLNPPPADVDDAMVRRAQHKMAQGMHADGPFLQGQPVRVAAPYQDSAVQFTTIWMLSDFTEENGATQLLTGSHRSPTNPTAIRAFDPTNLSEVVAARMGDLTRPDPAIVTAAGKAGDVILFDNRVW